MIPLWLCFRRGGRCHGSAGVVMTVVPLLWPWPFFLSAMVVDQSWLWWLWPCFHRGLVVVGTVDVNMQIVVVVAETLQLGVVAQLGVRRPYNSMRPYNSAQICYVCLQLGPTRSKEGNSDRVGTTRFEYESSQQLGYSFRNFWRGRILEDSIFWTSIMLTTIGILAFLMIRRCHFYWYILDVGNKYRV